jgi:putative membrane protein
VNYDLLRGLHILAVIAWMAGLLYLPRLFVYHVKAEVGSELDLTLRQMERRLYRFIMNPAMMVAWVLGLWLIWVRSGGFADASFLHTPWMIAKLAGVVFLTGWHHVLGRGRKAFELGQNTRSEKFWRIANEAPFVAAIVMVIAVTTEFGG